MVVYRYIDVDGAVKYIGIVHRGTLGGRHIAHKHDKWYKKEYKLEYITVQNRSEAEALESHFISKYSPEYNTAKKGWGEIGFAPEVEWEEFKG